MVFFCKIATTQSSVSKTVHLVLDLGIVLKHLPVLLFDLMQLKTNNLVKLNEADEFQSEIGWSKSIRVMSEGNRGIMLNK